MGDLLFSKSTARADADCPEGSQHRQSFECYELDSQITFENPFVEARACTRNPEASLPAQSSRGTRRALINPGTTPPLRGNRSSRSSVSGARNSPLQSSGENDGSHRTAATTPFTSAQNNFEFDHHSVNAHAAPDRDASSDFGTDTCDDEDDDTDDDTDIEAIPTINVPFASKDASGTITEYRLDINENELRTARRRGHAYLRIERAETEDEAFSRQEEDEKKHWMNGYLTRMDSEKHKVVPRKFVPGGKGKGGGRWVDAAEDSHSHFVVEWRVAEYRRGRWVVRMDDVERREEKSIEKGERRCESVQVQWRLELDAPPAPLRNRLTRGGDGHAAPSTRFQPPLMGTFSVEEERKYVGKRWTGRVLEEMRGRGRGGGGAAGPR